MDGDQLEGKTMSAIIDLKASKTVPDRYDDEYWDKRFNADTPERVKNAIKRVYWAYPPECLPKGLCDPMYIMNVICHELGIGDGQGNFNLPDLED